MSRCIFVNSNGQSGTHLVEKCVKLIGSEYIPLATNDTVGRVPADKPAWEQPDFDQQRHVLTGVNWCGYIEAEKLKTERFAPHVGPGRHGASHMFYTPAAERMFTELDMTMILVTRDSRDWVYSAARKIMENPEPYGRTKETPIEQHIHDLVVGFPPDGDVGRHPMAERYRRIMEWSQRPNVLTIRFEDTVGERGGGDDGCAMSTVYKIAQAMQISLSRDRCVEVVANLFGGTQTFRRGGIGSWREIAPMLEPYAAAFAAAL
jgi:hypothetical protein